MHYICTELIILLHTFFCSVQRIHNLPNFANNKFSDVLPPSTCARTIVNP